MNLTSARIRDTINREIRKQKPRTGQIIIGTVIAGSECSPQVLDPTSPKGLAYTGDEGVGTQYSRERTFNARVRNGDGHWVTIARIPIPYEDQGILRPPWLTRGTRVALWFASSIESSHPIGLGIIQTKVPDGSDLPDPPNNELKGQILSN